MLSRRPALSLYQRERRLTEGPLCDQDRVPLGFHSSLRDAHRSAPFEGANVSETFAGVLRQKIDFSRLPASTSTGIVFLIRRCLDRAPRRRRPEWAELNGDHVQIFHAELSREGHARAAFVAAQCGNDETLRREVEAMLAAHQEHARSAEPRLRSEIRLSRPARIGSTDRWGRYASNACPLRSGSVNTSAADSKKNADVMLSARPMPMPGCDAITPIVYGATAPAIRPML